jgi:putative ABC transport system permease protein
MDRWLQDIRFAIRTLGRQPAFTLIAVLTIGLAIGANTSIYSVVRAVLLRDLPYERSDELVVVWANLVARERPKFPISPPDLDDLRSQTTQFAGFAGITTFQQSLTGGDGVPERVDAAAITANFLELLGVQPILGRAFTPEDDDPFGPDVTPGNAPPQTVLISHALWQRQFGGAADVVGRTIQVNDNNAEVIGVLPPDVAILFGPGSGLATDVDLWFAPRINVAAWPARRNVIWAVVGRMKPGVAIEAARADVSRLSANLVAADPLRQTAGYRLDVFPMIEELTAAVQPVIWPLFGAVAFVLLIACANVSNLFLARASAREREFAIRTALGGARSRLVRQLMVESGVIAFAGAAFGLLLAFGGIRLLIGLAPANLPRLDTIGIDGWVLAYTALAAVVSAFLFGLVPALQASRPHFSQLLKDRGHSSGSRAQKLFRSGLVVAQVALSVVLLIGAGLMVRSFVAMQRVELGYRPEGLLTFNLSLPGNRYPDPQKLVFFRDFAERLRALPGVTQVSAATPIPLLDVQATGRYGPPAALGDESLYGQADYRTVLPGYFETMGTRLVEGRVFDESDFRDSALVVVIDEKLAGLVWPGRSAVGERMLIRATTLDPQFVQVIGVVEHQHAKGIGAEGPETVYLHNTYVGTQGNLHWVVRTTTDPVGLVPQVRAALAGIDPQLPLADIRSMADRVNEAMTGARFALVLIIVFGSIALVLAAVGIYGVLSFTVRQRTGEFGVRMALGADTRSVLLLVMRQGLTLTAVGLVVGVVAGFWATRLMGTLLVGVAPNDPATFALMTSLFVLAAVGAAYGPARRATLVSPAVALREEGE